MMKLATAAAFFDRTQVTDPDNGKALFRAQLDPFDDSRRDAGAAYRRIMSVKPGTRVPTARAGRALGQVWLIGATETDGLAEAHREKYVLQRADRKIGVYRLPGFLDQVVSSSAWASVEWLKDAKEVDTDSRTPAQCTVTMPLGTDVRERDVVADAAGALLVLQVHDSASGFVQATALRLDQAAPTTATITPRSYAPGTGFVTGAPYTVPALAVRWQSLFEYRSQLDARFQEGDTSLVLPLSTALTGRDRIDHAGVQWGVVSSQVIAGAVVAHVRRA